MFYQAVVSVVLLYGSESWVLLNAQLALGRLSHGVRRQTNGDVAAQAQGQVCLPQVRCCSARREAPIPPLLHIEAEGYRSKDHLITAHPGGVQVQGVDEAARVPRP